MNKSFPLVLACLSGILTIIAGIGLGLYAYQWWDQVNILFPAWGGKYALLPNLTEIIWCSCVVYLLLLALTCISATSHVCGDTMPKFTFAFVFIGLTLSLASSITLVLKTTESSCKKMRETEKKAVPSGILTKFNNWINEFTEGWSETQIHDYKESYESCVCEKYGNKIWIWIGFSIAALILGLSYVVVNQVEKKRIQDVLEGTPLSQGNYQYH